MHSKGCCKNHSDILYNKHQSSSKHHVFHVLTGYAICPPPLNITKQSGWPSILSPLIWCLQPLSSLGQGDRWGTSHRCLTSFLCFQRFQSLKLSSSSLCIWVSYTKSQVTFGNKTSDESGCLGDMMNGNEKRILDCHQEVVCSQLPWGMFLKCFKLQKGTPQDSAYPPQLQVDI